jgi:hypothetical protein
MPETAITENDFATLYEHQIGTTGQRLIVKSVAIA